MNGKICYIEMPTTDIARSADFYSRVFGWKTRKRKDGRTEWIPPPHLDSGQSRVNDYHHPENLLLPNDDEVD